MKILIVDDSSFERKVLRYILETHGYEIMDAEDGLDGLEKVRAYRPNVVISDILMPRMDGFQFLRNMKKDAQLKTIPFIFYSVTYTGDKDIELGLSMGANAYIIKPKKPEEFLKELKRAIEKVKSKEGARKTPIITEETFLKEYSHVVALKLEEKVQALEKEIAERKHLQNKLIEANARLEYLLNTSPAVIYSCKPSGNFGATFIGNNIKSQMGYEPNEFTGNSEFWVTHIHPEDVSRVLGEKNSIFEKGYNVIEYRFQHKDGTYRWMHDELKLIRDVDGHPMELVGFRIDITDYKRMQEEQAKTREQLFHAQKMESVGKLAGGVAHDFNNILTAIVGYGSLLQNMTKGNELAEDFVQRILKSAERAANLTRGLLVFSRKQPVDLKPENLNEIVKETESILSRLISEDIKVQTRLTDKRCIVMADSGQIEQVLMNLATNAKDAMLKGGLLSISTDIVEMDDGFIKTHGYGKPGKYALLSLADTGTGMDEKTKERIFEPFFSTKEVGKGTGLGLAIVHGIVTQHNGYVDVSSEVGKGTTFRVYLPLIQREVTKIPTEVHVIPKGGAETVLVAEDDEAVRKLTKMVLEGHGYKVIEAVNGADTIKKYMENKDKVQLLLLDVIMPIKNGREAYDEIKKINPDAKALFISGYSEEIMQEKDIYKKGFRFILKPILPIELLRKVRETLDK